MTDRPTADRDPRPERLLALLQLLRQHRRPVAAESLAARLRVSRRTLYRDIAALRGQGAPIEGEAGIGYLLRP
ncbi:MAG: helix-turn-helix domain-containing protein, partial [Rhodospirillales bacterium]|nr:helix-turn-helix domain-containing protein [Rhodospirillales bacterium]